VGLAAALRALEITAAAGHADRLGILRVQGALVIRVLIYNDNTPVL
jgi:hypothetical protein